MKYTHMDLGFLYYTLPALLIALTAFFLIDRMLRNDEKRRNFELRKDTQSQLLALRLRAYERLTLLLERTAPNTMVLSVLKPEMTCFDLQRELLSTVRQEFAHNVSQQIYVTSELWAAVKVVQESLLNLINICSSKCSPDDKASVLAELIVQVYAGNEAPPSETALDMLKKEVARML